MENLEPKNILEEIKLFIQRLENETKNDKRITDLLKGWKIYYSPILVNPTILFVGINPGAGELNTPFELDQEEHEKIHYLEEGRNNFELARNTKMIFENINGVSILENNSVKINSRFYATADEKDMYAFERILRENYFQMWEELMINNVKWLKEIINYLAPKIIICEGKSAFNYLDEKIFTDAEDWDYPLKYEENKTCGYFKRKTDNLILFGYSRKRGLNQNSFISQQLKNILKNEQEI